MKISTHNPDCLISVCDSMTLIEFHKYLFCLAPLVKNKYKNSTPGTPINIYLSNRNKTITIMYLREPEECLVFMFDDKVHNYKKCNLCFYSESVQKCNNCNISIKDIVDA